MDKTVSALHSSASWVQIGICDIKSLDIPSFSVSCTTG